MYSSVAPYNIPTLNVKYIYYLSAFGLEIFIIMFNSFAFFLSLKYIIEINHSK